MLFSTKGQIPLLWRQGYSFVSRLNCSPSGLKAIGLLTIASPPFKAILLYHNFTICQVQRLTNRHTTLTASCKRSLTTIAQVRRLSSPPFKAVNRRLYPVDFQRTASPEFVTGVKVPVAIINPGFHGEGVGRRRPVYCS